MIPPFTPPVRRPEIIEPFLTVNLIGGSGARVADMIFDLIHGANYNSPQRFVSRDYHRVKASGRGGSSCGCSRM